MDRIRLRQEERLKKPRCILEKISEGEEPIGGLFNQLNNRLHLHR